MSKFYIVYFKSITQYHNTNSGYYVSYKNKIEDNYSNNFIFAKRYMTLGSALNRIGLNYRNYSLSVKYITQIENGIDIFNGNRIEVVSIPNERKRKLSKLNNENFDSIKNLGKISDNELIKYFRKESDRFLSSADGKYYIKSLETKTATTEEIDDWCSHMDSVLSTDKQ